MAIFSSACASIISGSHYDVAIKSEPSGAHFEIRDENGVLQQSGTTPSVVDLRSGTAYFHKKNYSVNYSLDGYENEIQTIKSGMNGWYWGNFAIGGLIGFLIVDPLTGTMYRIRDKEVSCQMNKKEKEK